VPRLNRALAFSLTFALSIADHENCAAARGSAAWDIDVRTLLTAQAKENIVLLPKAIETTRPAICTFEQERPANGARQMLVVRISNGHEVSLGYQRIWLLYKTNDKATITHVLMPTADRVFASYTREVSLQKWDAVFEKFKRHKQRPPTPPYKERQPLRHGENWPRGYAGIANIFEDGKTRAYLLATDDIWRLRVQNPIEEAACRLLAGMHCRVGAEVKNGWAEVALESLLNLETTPPITATRDVVGQIDEDCLPK
jgi:hypothetical protein